MLRYKTPEIKISEIHIDSEIAATFTEVGGDNDTDWLENWTSAIGGNN